MNLSTIKQAAAILGVSHRTLERWVQQGTVGSWKIGGRRLVDAQEILRQHRAPAMADRVGKASKRIQPIAGWRERFPVSLIS